MQPARLNLINLGIIGGILLLVVLSFFFKVMQPSSIEVVEKPTEKPTMPKHAFALAGEEYEKIGPPFLSLKFSPMALQVPDLKRYLVYHGKNDRPDADPAHQKLNFGFTGAKGSVSANIKEPIYIIYDKHDSKAKYKFSPGNAPTSLWFEAMPAANPSDVLVMAAVKNEAGNVVREPQANAEFTLKERPQVRHETEERKLGDFKVDGTLLARQGAKWYGTDKFMERHGGEEYKDFIGKQRIDFGTGENVYSVYVGPDSVMAWIDGEWQEIKPGKESEKYPIMMVTKIEDRIMRLEFWDVGGQGKTTLNLIKSMDTWIPDSLQKEFSFIGARTRSQFLFEINKERMTLSPQDWLLRTDKGWKKLTTAQDIDDYVERKITGPLFVFDGIEKRDGKQVLVGTLYNKARTETKTIEIPMSQGAVLPEPKRERKNIPVSVSDDDEEELDDEEDETEEVDAEKLREKMMERLMEKNNMPRPGATK